jgi:glutamate 5-kinase
MRTAQILLTHDDLSDRKRYLNARSTLRTLVNLDVIPVINENDTVVTDEIRFGDNDTLAALVANLVEADLLVILTDRDGMYNADPRHNPDAELISEARADDPALDAVAGGVGGALGRGGMQTKLRASRLAARSGAHTVIVGGAIEQVLARLRGGRASGHVAGARARPAGGAQAVAGWPSADPWHPGAGRWRGEGAEPGPQEPATGGREGGTRQFPSWRNGGLRIA